MVTESPFPDLDAVEQELRLSRQRRDRHGYMIQRHFDALQDREHRGLLMKDAMHDLLRSWKPAEVVGAALGPSKGLFPLLFQMVTTRGGLKRRMLMAALSVAAPALLQRLDLAKVVHGVATLFRKSGKVGQNGVHTKEAQEEDDPIGSGLWQ